MLKDGWVHPGATTRSSAASPAMEAVDFIVMDDSIAEQDGCAERGRAAAVDNANVTGRPRR